MIGDNDIEARGGCEAAVVRKADLAGLEVRLRELGGGPSRRARQGHEAVAGVGDREYEILGLVVRVDRMQILQRDDDGAALGNAQIEVACDLGRHVAHLGAQAAADLHGQRPVLHVAADGAGVANFDQVLDDDVALQGAANFGVFRLYSAIALAVGVNDQRAGGDVAFNVAVDLHLLAVANFTLDDGVFSDHQYALIFSHRRAPVPHGVVCAFAGSFRKKFASLWAGSRA